MDSQHRGLEAVGSLLAAVVEASTFPANSMMLAPLPSTGEPSKG